MPANLHPYQIAVGVLLAIKIALFVSLVAGNPDMFVYGDGLEYVARARGLLEWGVYGSFAPDGSYSANAFRLPAYPAFLAGLAWITPGLAQGLVWSTAQLLLFHTWLLAAGGWIAHRQGGHAALYFVVGLSLPLPWVHYVMAVHSDYLFALLTFSAVMLLMSANEPAADRMRFTIGAAVCMGLAALTRPDLVFLPFWLIVPITGAAIWNIRRSPKVAIGPNAIVALAAFGFMALWTVRNFVQTGRVVFTSVTDTVVVFFARNIDATAVGGQGTGLIETLELMVKNGARILAEFVPALAQLFFNPSRWYLHRYFESWGAELASKDVPYTELGFSGLAMAEQVYLVIGVMVPIALFAVAARGLYRLLRGHVTAALWPIFVMLWIMAYLVLQKGVWGALTPGSSPRYAMSIWPFVIYLGALAFARQGHFMPAAPADPGRPRGDR